MNIFKRNESPTIQGQIDEVLTEMGDYKPTEDEWEDLLTKLERLDKLKGAKRPKLSPDQIVAGAVSLISVVAVIRHEQFNVLASKAVGFIIKPKM